MNRGSKELTANITRGRAGFTLLEVLTSIVVLSVATSVFVQLYRSSLTFEQTSRSHRIAAKLAEEFLAEIRTTPGAFDWPTLEGAAPGTLLSVPVANDGVESFSMPPATIARSPRAARRAKAQYNDFSRQAFVRVPPSNQPYVDLIVEIAWLDGHRQRAFALSGVLPRTTVEGGSP